MSKTIPTDWRERLFGSHLQVNQTSAAPRNDEEAPTDVVPTFEMLDEQKYDYVAVFIGADYCPHCKLFAPTVKASAPFLEAKKCKVLFASNDRTPEAFQASCEKNLGIDVIPYDLDKTKAMRDLFDLKTIPALMVLRNKNFDATAPEVVINARNILEEDKQARHFPWVDDSHNMSAWDRLIINGRYGNWWELGHHVNPEKPDQIYMDEHAVRIRAGLLNVITWVAITNVFHLRNVDLVNVLFPVVAFEFLTSMIFGLTPLAPIGFLGTIIAIILQPHPHWKPARPKRFAWFVGLILSTTCFLLVQFRKELGDSYRPSVITVVLMCNIFTWLEASAGFCFGCYVWNTWIVPMFKLEQCSECKL